MIMAPISTIFGNLVSAGALLYFILGFQAFCCTREGLITACTGRSGVLQG